MGRSPPVRHIFLIGSRRTLRAFPCVSRVFRHSFPSGVCPHELTMDGRAFALPSLSVHGTAYPKRSAMCSLIFCLVQSLVRLTRDCWCIPSCVPRTVAMNSRFIFSFVARTDASYVSSCVSIAFTCVHLRSLAFTRDLSVYTNPPTPLFPVIRCGFFAIPRVIFFFSFFFHKQEKVNPVLIERSLSMCQVNISVIVKSYIFVPYYIL